MAGTPGRVLSALRAILGSKATVVTLMVDSGLENANIDVYKRRGTGFTARAFLRSAGEHGARETCHDSAVSQKSTIPAGPNHLPS